MVKALSAYLETGSLQNKGWTQGLSIIGAMFVSVILAGNVTAKEMRVLNFFFGDNDSAGFTIRSST